MANRRPNFQIPDVINPVGRRCIQIMIPDDPQHIQIFAGLTRQLLDWQRWERDPLKRGTQVAKVWSEVWRSIDWTGEDCMGCCPEPTNVRYNEDGVLEVSYDGGITWEPSPADDSRLSGAIAPPLAGADGATKRCTGARAAQEYVKQAFLEDLTDGAGYADLYAAAVAVVAALGVTGVGILVAAAAAAIFILGVSATLAAFTTEVWSEFKCILYCNMEDDASFTVAGWEAVKSQVLSSFTGIVSAVLYNWVNSVGVVGLTNSARSHFEGEGDCSDCNCGTCGSKYEIFELSGHFYGEILEVGDDYIIARSDGESYLTLVAKDFNDCCWVNSIELIEGVDAAGTAHENCGSEPVLPWIAATPIGGCRSLMEFQGSPPLFTIKINLAPCP